LGQQRESSPEDTLPPFILNRSSPAVKTRIGLSAGISASFFYKDSK